MIYKKRKTPFTRDPSEDLENMRDDCVALFVNSKLSQKEIHARGGPTPGTISKWIYKETLFPRYETIDSFLMALGFKLAVVSQSDNSLFIRTTKAPTLQRPKKTGATKTRKK